MPSVLFVCTANRFRSPLAAAMFIKNLEELGISRDWRVSSAGTWAEAGLPVILDIPNTIQKFGIDLSEHRSVSVSGQLLSDYDLILVMEAGHKEALLSEFPKLQNRVHLLSEVVEHRSYDIPDAMDSEQDALEVVAELKTLIQDGCASICALATSLNHTRHGAES
jgi:protein-tyrosine phosphatase